MVKTVEVSRRDEELWSMPSIQSQMPVTFEGGSKWTDLEGKCAGCKQPISDDHLHGSIRRPLATVAEVEAVGICQLCELLTRFSCRIHADMRITGLTANGWQEWRPDYAVMDRLVITWRGGMRYARQFLTKLAKKK